MNNGLKFAHLATEINDAGEMVHEKGNTTSFRRKIMQKKQDSTKIANIGQTEQTGKRCQAVG